MKPALLSLIAALAGSSAAYAASDDPDAIYVNGKIVTVDAAFSVQQAFSLKGDRFGVVSTNEKVRAVAGKGTRVVDLRGAAVIPYYVTRKTHEGEIRTPTEKISREQALRIFTVNHAVATFQEKSKGQIAPGMLADFVILNQDLMTVPEEKILATRPLATFVGGRKVYSAVGVQF